MADVDNDGNAEIVFATSTESTFCDGDNDNAAIEALYNDGIEVWGDKNDLWVSARRVWNQHAYHVTNVTEGGSIPVYEPESWKPLNGRLYNTYRSNPRSFGVAPDLTIQGIQVSSPDATCGELSSKLDITVQVANIGDLRIGPGVVITYRGEWTAQSLTEPLKDGIGAPLIATIQNSLEPGESLLITVPFDAANNMQATLPDKVFVTVDDGNQERECDESNNDATKDVEAGQLLPDLRIQIGAIDAATCPDPKVPTTVFNDGSAPASNYVVRYYAGDPNAGGNILREVTRPGPLGPNETDSFTETLDTFPQNLSILIYGVVDPDNAIEECNDGNNQDAADNKVGCSGIY